MSKLSEANRIQIKVLTLNIDKAREKIKALIGKEINYDVFLLETRSVLMKLRKLFYYFKDQVTAFTEAAYFQPLFTMFVDSIILKLNLNLPTDAGSSLPLRVPISVKATDCDELTQVELEALISSCIPVETETI
jgi:hypothetical protein